MPRLRMKLNADVLFVVSKRLLDEIDVRPSAVVGRVERGYICREGFQERAQFARRRTVLRGMSGDQPRWPRSGHRADLCSQVVMSVRGNAEHRRCRLAVGATMR